MPSNTKIILQFSALHSIVLIALTFGMRFWVKLFYGFEDYFFYSPDLNLVFLFFGFLYLMVVILLYRWQIKSNETHYSGTKSILKILKHTSIISIISSVLYFTLLASNQAYDSYNQTFSYPALIGSLKLLALPIIIWTIILTFISIIVGFSIMKNN